MPLLLLLLAAVSALCSLLNFGRAPDSMWAWKLAILAGEFGHWLVLLPLGLALLAGFGATDGVRLATLLLCGVAVTGFLRKAGLTEDQLETNKSIYDRYVASLPVALRARAEAQRLTVTGKPILHRAKHGHTAVHDPLHTLFLVPGPVRIRACPAITCTAPCFTSATRPRARGSSTSTTARMAPPDTATPSCRKRSRSSRKSSPAPRST